MNNYSAAMVSTNYALKMEIVLNFSEQNDSNFYLFTVHTIMHVFVIKNLTGSEVSQEMYY